MIPLQSKKVYVLYTGGTFGMEHTPTGWQPAPSGKIQAFLAQHPQLNQWNTPLFEITEVPEPIDSSGLEFEHWNLFARFIETHHEQAQGFVIIHGTDTLAYSAAMLSLMLKGLGCPVILTGAQRSLFQPQSDALANFQFSLLAAASNKTPPRIWIGFAGELLAGEATTKWDTEADQGFFMPFPERLLPLEETLPFSVTYLHRQPKIAVIWCFPGMDETLFFPLVQEAEAIILATFGAGNRVFSQAFLTHLHQAKQRGARLINKSQCLKGMVKMDTYAVAEPLKTIGCESAGAKTFEYVLTECFFLSQKNQATLL